MIGLDETVFARSLILVAQQLYAYRKLSLPTYLFGMSCLFFVEAFRSLFSSLHKELVVASLLRGAMECLRLMYGVCSDIRCQSNLSPMMSRFGGSQGFMDHIKMLRRSLS